MRKPRGQAEASPEERIREICLAALERRPRSRRELELQLRRKGVKAQDAAPVLDRLTEVGLVDDEAFARAWVASRQRSRPLGRRGLESELRGRGVDPDVIARVLDDIETGEEPVETARRAAAVKLRTLSGRPPAEARRKAEQFLLRRGFSFETVREALRGLLDPAEEDPPQ